MDPLSQKPFFIPSTTMPLEVYIREAKDEDKVKRASEGIFIKIGNSLGNIHPSIVKAIYAEDRHSENGFFTCPDTYLKVFETFGYILGETGDPEDAILTSSPMQHQKYREILKHFLGTAHLSTIRKDIENFALNTVDEWVEQCQKGYFSLGQSSKYYIVNTLCQLLFYYKPGEEIVGCIEFLHQYVFLKTQNREATTAEELAELFFVKNAINEFLEKISNINSPFLAELSKNFSLRQIKFLILFILFGAQETSSSLIQAMIYELAKNNSLQEEIHQEISHKKASYPGNLFNNLESLQNLFKEALRLYPPIFLVPRKTAKDLILEMKDEEGEAYEQFLPKETEIHHCPGHMGNDPEMFPEETKKFNPKRHCSLTMSWYPFGASGNYNCPGQWWAREVIKTLVGVLVQNCTVSCQNEKFACAYQFSLKPLTDLMVQLKRRD